MRRFRVSHVRGTVLAVALLSGSGAAAAQSESREQRGVVLDESGGAITGARFVLRSTHGAVLQEGVTVEDGAFALRGLRPGSYWLEVSAREFRPRHIRLDIVPETAAIRIVLGLAPFQSDVTVTAQRGMVAEVEDTPPVVTVRDRDDFRRRPIATVANALDGAPGVMVQQSTYGQASPFLRGLTGYHVLNLVDGVRFNNATFRSGPNQYLAFADPAQVQRVEAMLGPASSQFGSDALGGAIQVLTPSITFADEAGATTAAEANLFASSADASTGGDASIFVRTRRVSWTAGGTRRRLDDLRGGGGTNSHHVLRRLFGLSGPESRELTGSAQRDTGFTQSGVHAKMAARLGTQQNLTVWYQRSEQEGVQGAKDLWGGLGRLQSDFEPQLLDFFYTRYERLGAGWLDWLSGTFSRNAQDDGSVRQGLRSSDRIVRDDVRVEAFGYAAQAGARVARRHALVFGGEVYDEGIEARRDDTDPRTGVTAQTRALYPNGSHYTTTGLFAQDVVELASRTDGRPALTAHLGGRFTHVRAATVAERNVTAAGQSLGVIDAVQAYRDWTFNAGLTWHATSVVSVNVLTGRGFRAPNLNDLGALGLSDLGYEVPAEAAIERRALVGLSDGEGALSSGRAVAALRSERLFNYEIGATLQWRRVYARVQAFHAELQDPIVRRTLVFPAAAAPSTLAGLAVSPIAATAAQREQDVVSVATADDPRAVKAFVNDGRASYYGGDAQLRYDISRRWSIGGSYSYLVGHDLDPKRPVRRLPPQHGFVSARYQPDRRVLSWVEASAHLSGAQERLSGGDLTDERIGAARRRSDITDFFNGGLVAPFISSGVDGVPGSADDVFAPTGETLAQIRDRVLPIGVTINGVRIVDDSTRVPLYTRTPPFASLNLRAGFTLTRHLNATVGVMNLFDHNYRVHGSGVDAPGINAFASVNVSY